jgi:adenylyltransferase/sulfurtransferase
MNKARSLRESIARINSDIRIEAIEARLDDGTLHEHIAACDLVVDASDNFATRHAINRACVTLGRPLVSGAALGFSGQIAVFDTRDPDGACYHCLFPDTGMEDAQRCAENGVFAPLVGVIGSMQAANAMRTLLRPGKAENRLWLFDALTGETRGLRLARDPGCPVCGQRA